MKNSTHKPGQYTAPSPERSPVLDRYISERQPFHIRWGMFIIAFVLLLLAASSFFITIPVTLVIRGELWGLEAKTITVIIADTSTGCKIKEGQTVQLSVVNSDDDKTSVLNGRVSRINCAANTGKTVVYILPENTDAATVNLEKLIAAHLQVQLRFQKGNKRLFSYLYTL